MPDRRARSLADTLWDHSHPALAEHPRPGRPLMVQMAGVPLVGKSTLARALATATGTALLHVENDAVRQHVLDALGREEPAFDGEENRLTYATARALAHRALAWGAHVIHDATNLSERERQGGYRTADLAGRATAVLFVDAPRDRLTSRAETLPPHRQRAFEALGHRQPYPPGCSRPYLVLDGTRPPEANVAKILAAPATAQLRS